MHRISRNWSVDGERFDGVILATGRFARPRMAAAAAEFGGQLVHACECPGRAALEGCRTLVYGNGVSGLEIAGDLAAAGPLTSAFRKPRYAIEKVTDGISSDWRWYTLFGALERRHLPGRLRGATT